MSSINAMKLLLDPTIHTAEVERFLGITESPADTASQDRDGKAIRQARGHEEPVERHVGVSGHVDRLLQVGMRGHAVGLHLDEGAQVREGLGRVARDETVPLLGGRDHEPD